MKYICLGSFLAASSVFAFNPDATGWYGESAINTGLTHSSDMYRPITDVGEATTTQWDWIFRQSVGYRHYVTTEFQFLLGMALGGSDGAVHASESKNSTWEIGIDVFTSIDLWKNKSVYLEPALGYQYLREKIKGGSYNYWWTDNRASAHGPTAGLYLRFYHVEKLSFRVGSSFLLLPFTDRFMVETEEGEESEAYYQLRVKLSDARKGLSTSLSMAYSPTPSMTIQGAIESRSISSEHSGTGGGPIVARGDGLRDYYDSWTFRHYLTQYRISWGVRWNY